MIVNKNLNEVVVVISLFLVMAYYFVYVEFIKVPDPPTEVYTKEVIQLSKLINAEADKRDTADMYLVGSSVLNRIDAGSHPGTQDSVIKQRAQYKGLRTGEFKRTPLSDSIAMRLYRGYGRNYEVLYFYNRKMATDKEFLELMGNKHNFIAKTKVHMFYGAPK